MSTVQTPKHSKLEELKLFSQTKYIKPAVNWGTSISKAIKQKELGKSSSQPSFLKIPPKRKSSRSSPLIPCDKKDIYLNKWYFINGKKVKI